MSVKCVGGGGFGFLVVCIDCLAWLLVILADSLMSGGVGVAGSLSIYSKPFMCGSCVPQESFSDCCCLLTMVMMTVPLATFAYSFASLASINLVC